MSALGRKQTLGGLQPDCARPLLAQLDRAPGFEPGGWGFKSLGAGHPMSGMGGNGHSLTSVGACDYCVLGGHNPPFCAAFLDNVFETRTQLPSGLADAPGGENPQTATSKSTTMTVGLKTRTRRTRASTREELAGPFHRSTCICSIAAWPSQTFPVGSTSSASVQ